MQTMDDGWMDGMEQWGIHIHYLSVKYSMQMMDEIPRVSGSGEFIYTIYMVSSTPCRKWMMDEIPRVWKIGHSYKLFIW